jgi:hypothetical protein
MAIKPWIFQQLGGQRNHFTLSGLHSPHGRPRQKPVVVESEKLRMQTTPYDEEGVDPTRHIFASQHEPWELTGRFQDRELGKRGALEKKQELQEFYRAKQLVSIKWGDVVAYRGILSEIGFKIEAEYDIEYFIKIELDADDTRPVIAAPKTPRGPNSLMLEINLMLDLLKSKLLAVPNALDLRPSFLEFLEDLVAAVLTPFAFMTSISDQIGSFENALAGDLRRLVAGVNQGKTACLNLRDATESALLFDIIMVPNGNNTVRWLNTKADVDSTLSALLALLADFIREINVSSRGSLERTETANDGETWETFSNRIYGGPDGAGKLRDANAVSAGSKPQAGKRYHIPV